MDEVEDVVRGNINRWRIERRFAYLNVIANGTMKNPEPITKMFPLPYDDELGEGEMSEDDILASYEKYKGLL